MTQHTTHLLLLALAATATQAFAQPSTAPATLVQRELIYCAGQMSPEERAAYRTKMQATRSAAEKDALRATHRSEMRERARAAGREDECEPRGPKGAQGQQGSQGQQGQQGPRGAGLGLGGPGQGRGQAQ